MSIRYFKYELPLSTPFSWANQSISQREGMLVRFKNDDIISWGEIAPLPGISAHTTDEVAEWLNEELITQIDSLLSEDCSFPKWTRTLDSLELPPSLRFGHDMLFIQAKAQYQQCSTSAFLFNQSLEDIAINATLSIQEEETFLKEADRFYNRGFRTFKCKMGRNFRKEYQCLKALRNRYPNIDIRLDVNGAWTPEETRNNLISLAPLKIQYCEQPIAAGCWSDLTKLASQSPIDLALDESISDLESLKRIIESKDVHYIVVKPMKLGALSPLITLCRKAIKQSITPVFSSLLDTGIARSMYAVLASGLSQRNTAHGLATGHIFERDLLPIDRVIRDGRYPVNNKFSVCSRWSSRIKHQNLDELAVT